MLPSDPVFNGMCLRPSGAAVAGVLASLLLVSCASSGGDPNRGLTTVASEQAQTIELYLKQGYCPPIQIRPGTESLVVHERGHEGEANYIRYQGSITQTARECHTLGPQTLSIKLGIAGRLTAGPKGGPGSATLPIRVAVVKQAGAAVLYSEVFKVPVTVVAPQYSADFTQVIEGVNLELGPYDRDLIVYIGFDEGPPKPTG